MGDRDSSTSSDELPAEPHPDAPTNDEGDPIHPRTGERICGVPKVNDHENLYPYCLRTGFWIETVGICQEHFERAPDDAPF